MLKRFSSAVKFSLFIPFALMLFGCQQQPEPQPMHEQLEQDSGQHEAADLTLLCNKLEQHMQEISSQRTTFALEQVNQDLKVCLPLQSLAQQRLLLQRSNAMYRNFLQVERTASQQLAFQQYAFDMAQHPTIHQSHFEQLTIRDQYLLKHQGQAYIELAGAATEPHYRRNPEYLAKIFAPYMPEAERVFIENLALQNIEPAFSDQALLIEPFEIARRALFWEDYVRQYPKSSYIQDAKHLQYQYALFLFKGLKKSPVSGAYADRFDVQVSSMEEISKIAKIQRSSLARQAQRFVQFIDLSPEQREQALGASSGISPWQQMERYLQLRDPAPRYSKDCFSDGVCL